MSETVESFETSKGSKMPLIPILISALPSLISVAEKVFVKGPAGESKGASKKAFVLAAIGQLYDSLHLERVLPDFERVDERKLFLDMASVMVEHLVPELT